jgi:hypothetical protein
VQTKTTGTIKSSTMSADKASLNSAAHQPADVEKQAKTPGQPPSWKSLSTDKSHVLFQFGSELKAILNDAAYDEMYGVRLVAPEEG